MERRILVVDDSSTARAFISKALTLSGIGVTEIVEAGNGREALKILESQNIDMVLTDIHMPEMNGIELIQAMVENGMTDDIPVIVLTSNRSVQCATELPESGFKALLRKPCTPEDIKQVADEVLVT